MSSRLVEYFAITKRTDESSIELIALNFLSTFETFIYSHFNCYFCWVI